MNVMEIGIVSNVLLKYKTANYHFSNCFSNAEVDTAASWLRSFPFAWNQLT